MKRPPPRLIYNEYWWLVHDPRSGKELQQHQLMRVGLAACLVADLLLGHHIAIRQSSDTVLRVELLPAAAVPEDDVMAFLLKTIRDEKYSHSLGTWLTVFADRGHGCVLARLVATERLHRRGVLRRWAPTNPTTAEQTIVRIARGLQSGAWYDTHADPVLAALAWATGMDQYLLDQQLGDPQPGGGAELIAATVAELPPALAAVVRETRTKVDFDVVTDLV